MKNRKEYTGEGKNLFDLLAMRFGSQREAAAFLDMSQPALHTHFNREKLSSYFWRVYAPKLEIAGLNPQYIKDPAKCAPFFEEAAEAEIAKLRARMIELETMKQRANVHA